MLLQQGERPRRRTGPTARPRSSPAVPEPTDRLRAPRASRSSAPARRRRRAGRGGRRCRRRDRRRRRGPRSSPPPARPPAARAPPFPVPRSRVGRRTGARGVRPLSAISSSRRVNAAAGPLPRGRRQRRSRAWRRSASLAPRHITTRQSIPSAAAPRRAPGRGFPPRSRSRRAPSRPGERAELFSTPRALNEPVFWKSSAFSQTRSPICSEVNVGVGAPARGSARRRRARRRGPPTYADRRLRDVDGHPVQLTVTDDRPLPADRFLPPAPGDPALRLADPLVGRGLLRRDRSVVRGARHDPAAGGPSLPRRLRALHDAPRRLSDARGESLSRLHGRPGYPLDVEVPSRSRSGAGRSRCGCFSRSRRCSLRACSAEHERWKRRATSRTPATSTATRTGTRRRCSDVRVPRLVRVARARPDAERAADLAAAGIGYGAQAYAAGLLLTDRYPNADPSATGQPWSLDRTRCGSCSRTTAVRSRPVLFGSSSPCRTSGWRSGRSRRSSPRSRTAWSPSCAAARPIRCTASSPRTFVTWRT